MEGLRLNRLKQKIKAQEDKDKALREAVHAALGDAHEGLADVIVQRTQITLQAKNKAAANEMFLRREEIRKLLPGWVTDLKIQ